MRKATSGTRLLVLLVGVGLTACPKAELPHGEPASDTPSVTASGELEVASASEQSAEETAAAVRRAVVTGVTVTRVEVERAEDGRGQLVDAAQPVAIEIAAEAWPARALDPVLRIGALEFRHYTYPRINVLRYVAADASALSTESPVTVQYGDDAASRVVVSERLEVPR